jgi:hypothetical protein
MGAKQSRLNPVSDKKSEAATMGKDICVCLVSGSVYRGETLKQGQLGLLSSGSRPLQNPSFRPVNLPAEGSLRV